MYTKVTISGKICTGKSTLYWGLQKKLGWATYSASHFFRDYARSHGTSLEKAEEQNPNLTKEIDFGMQKMLREKDHIIIEGWMSGIMAKGIDSVQRVLLTCEDEERIKRFASREGITKEEAAKRISDRESNLFAKLESIYNRSDFTDSANYDVVIDTTKNTSEATLTTALQKIGS